MLRVKSLFFIKNTLGDWFGYIKAITLKPCVGLIFSCLTNSKCFLLFILIEQGRRIVIHDFVDIHAIVVSYPLMVDNKRLCNVMECFDTNIFLLSIFLGFIFLFFFFFFLVTMKRHMTLQSHDMSHDVTS